MRNLSETLKTRVRSYWAYEIDFEPSIVSKKEICDWCEKNLKNKWNHEQLYFSYFRIHIEDDNDYLMFMLRWGDKCNTN